MRLFKITYNHLDNVPCKVSNLCEYNKHLETPFKFQMFDDDGYLYFSGECSEEEFDPLDDYGEAFGCTEIKYFNEKTQKYETL
jgi:hypothetical protein